MTGASAGDACCPLRIAQKAFASDAIAINKQWWQIVLGYNPWCVAAKMSKESHSRRGAPSLVNALNRLHSTRAKHSPLVPAGHGASARLHFPTLGIVRSRFWNKKWFQSRVKCFGAASDTINKTQQQLPVNFSAKRLFVCLLFCQHRTSTEGNESTETQVLSRANVQRSNRSQKLKYTLKMTKRSLPTCLKSWSWCNRELPHVATPSLAARWPPFAIFCALLPGVDSGSCI